jgi:TPR repeat protein
MCGSISENFWTVVEQFSMSHVPGLLSFDGRPILVRRLSRSRSWSAAEYYRLSAEQGNAKGQYWFGHCLVHGRGIKQDLIRRAEYYRLSAGQGNARGQYNFGVCLENGAGTWTDLTMAAHYYKLAFDQGIIEAYDSYRRCLRSQQH